MIQLLLSDLDGTLLHDDKTVSDYSVKMLRKLKEKGIFVGFSTGRAATAIESYLEKIQPNVLIANGGAEIYVENRCIHTSTFTAAQVQTLFDAAYKICGSDVEITCDAENKIFWNRMPEKHSAIYAFDSEYNDFKSFGIPAMKMCVQTWDKDKAVQIASAVGLDFVNYIKFSDIPWYSFYPKNVTKENAIKILTEHLNISLSNVAAFGDDYNDMGMLQLCGIGVAMENAIPEVKKAADQITLSNNQDGVAKWISRHIFE